MTDHVTVRRSALTALFAGFDAGVWVRQYWPLSRAGQSPDIRSALEASDELLRALHGDEQTSPAERALRRLLAASEAIRPGLDEDVEASCAVATELAAAEAEARAVLGLPQREEDPRPDTLGGEVVNTQQEQPNAQTTVERPGGDATRESAPPGHIALCPFCGGHDAYVAGSDVWGFRVVCPSCYSAGGAQPEGLSADSAIAAWNRRAAPLSTEAAPVVLDPLHHLTGESRR